MADFAINIYCHGNFSLLKVIYLMLLLNNVYAVLLKKECPADEAHRSCSFFEEYTCWKDEYRFNRVMTLPHRLAHCTSGCFCKKGLVRGYPNGPCIQTPYCLNERIREFLSKLPA